MRIRSVARARLIECLLTVALLVAQLPTATLIAAPKHDDGDQIWACQKQGGTLRLVADRADCARHESALNLNNAKNPLSLCVTKDDQVLSLARAAKSGTRHDDCDPNQETFLKLPGNDPTSLCAEREGPLAICANESKPDATVPPRNQQADAGDDQSNDPAAGAEPTAAEKSKEPAAAEEPQDSAPKSNRSPKRKHHKDRTATAAAVEPQDPGAGDEPEDLVNQEPSKTRTVGAPRRRSR